MQVVQVRGPSRGLTWPTYADIRYTMSKRSQLYSLDAQRAGEVEAYAAMLGVSKSALVNRAIEYFVAVFDRDQGASLRPWAERAENRARVRPGKPAMDPRPKSLPARLGAILTAEPQTLGALAMAVMCRPGDVWNALRVLVTQGVAVVHRETGEAMPDPLLWKPLRAVPGAHTARLVGGGR